MDKAIMGCRKMGLPQSREGRNPNRVIVPMDRENLVFC
jgi:hypothetical protein